jgi:hypothetical protein
MNQFSIGTALQIGSETLLMAVYRMKETTVAIERQVVDVELSAKVAAVRTLDLDDPSTQTGQAESGGRAGQKLAEVNEEQSFKGLHCDTG